MSRKSKLSARIVQQGRHIVNEVWLTYTSKDFRKYEMDLKTKRGEADVLMVDPGKMVVSLYVTAETTHGDGRVKKNTLVEISDPVLNDSWQVLSAKLSKYHVEVWMTKAKVKRVWDVLYSRVVAH